MTTLPACETCKYWNSEPERLGEGWGNCYKPDHDDTRIGVDVAVVSPLDSRGIFVMTHQAFGCVQWRSSSDAIEMDLRERYDRMEDFSFAQAVYVNNFFEEVGRIRREAPRRGLSKQEAHEIWEAVDRLSELLRGRMEGGKASNGDAEAKFDK